MARYIPYKSMTSKKWDSLGEELTLKQALDLWWNSVRVRTKKGTITCYKTCDKEYIVNGDYATKDQLNKTILLDEEYDLDADNYPIVFATLKGTL